jgi:hypothetical protein
MPSCNVWYIDLLFNLYTDTILNITFYYDVLYQYRVNTKELHTFKMIQKTNAAYLKLHTYTS